MEAHLRIQAGQYTLAGVKPDNEDSCGIRIGQGSLLLTKGIVAVIADGVSASAAGREAAETCVQGFISDYFSTPETWSVKNAGHQVLSALNRWLYGMGQQHLGRESAQVTTLSVLVLKSATAHLFHVGDTRIYLFRNGELERLTEDHRVLVKGDRNYLSRAMGIDLHLEVDYRTVPIELGDTFLLTSDGVHDFLDDPHLAGLLAEHAGAAESAGRAIVASALEKGGTDNVTAQVLTVTSLPTVDLDDLYANLTALPFPPPLEPGMTLDGYRILRELFANKRTQIYLALDEHTGRQVVLKTPSVNYEDSPEYIDGFLREEWAGRRVRNPHVLEVLELQRPRRFLYYITEFVEGQTLRQWMDTHPEPPLAKVVDLIRQAAAGLRAFHRLEMVHNDLKPENLVMDDHGTLKIIDFGSTKIAGLEEIASPLEHDGVVGTFNYSAPECIRGERGTVQSDLFSLGVIAYEMLCHHLPYGSMSAPRGERFRSYQSVRKHRPGVPVWMDKTLQKAVSWDSRRRYAVLSEFIHDLSHPNPHFLTEEFTPLLEKDPVAFWRGLALVLLGVCVILVYLLTR